MDSDTLPDQAPEALNYILAFLLVGIAWGFTTPFIRRAAVEFNSRNDSMSLDGEDRRSWVERKATAVFWTVVNLLRTPAYAVPLLLNLTGSVWFFLLVGKHELSLTVPITNSMAFLFTVLGECLAQASRTNSAAITGDLCLMGRWYLRLSRTRPHRLRWRRAALLSLAVFFIIDLLRITSYGRPSVPEPRSTLKKPIPQPRVFIASIHWNNEAILRAHWNNALLDLVRHLGPENVFVSILESGSWDGSKDALRGLDAELETLGVQRKVVLDETTHADEIRHAPPPGVPGWIWTSRGKRELRRIPYLSRLRNRVMEDLSFLQSQRDHRRFDKVLWLNDVIFTTNDVLNLLNTRSGEYAAACSLDFSKPPHYYDTFALRDASGAKAITSTWPYFLSSKSRRALISNTPVPVKSCWNGIIFFDATTFYNTPTLKFRGTADSLANYRLEGSECCLIHADNPLTPTKGVWLNPNVRVGYNEDAYRLVNPSAPATWPNLRERVGGIWRNRIARWTNIPRRTLENLIVKWRLRRWKAENKSGVEESGVHCLINEMQVLVSNGWAHV
ncbi:hypothetical protein LOZ58_004197 [Ophidiomyces ophidiicola]|nr:hypothetical protein LOZ58_004197 [Ophidiomyces ophidiicola]